MIILSLVLIGLICGGVGALVARHKGASVAAGFALGALFGPLGIIVAALLSGSARDGLANQTAESASAVQDTPPEADLQSARYKVWLIDTYGITRNDVLGAYILGEQSYATADEALVSAHELELASRMLADDARRKRGLEEEEERQRKIESARAADERFDRCAKMVALVMFVAAAVMALWFLYNNHVERQAAASARAERNRLLLEKKQEQQEAARTIVRKLGLAEGDIRFDQVEIHEKSISCLAKPREVSKTGREFIFNNLEEPIFRVLVGRIANDASLAGYVRFNAMGNQGLINGQWVNLQYPPRMTVCETG